MNLQAGVPSDLIPYLLAKKILTMRFPETTSEEIAIWIFLGSYPHFDIARGDLDDEINGDWTTHETNMGGFSSYYDNKDDKTKTEEIHNRACVGETIEWNDILDNLFRRRFSQAEIESFTPPDRWISYHKLLARWTKRCSKQALINKKLDRDGPGVLRELTMSYPVLIIEQTKEDCMYSVNEIEAIEEKEFPSEITDEGKATTESVGEPEGISISYQSSGNVATKAKNGRPKTRHQKAELLRRIITQFETAAGCEFIDASQRFLDTMNIKPRIFTSTEDTMKTWLRLSGFRFKVGRTRKGEEKFWTRLCPETLSKTHPEVFRRVFDELLL